MSDLLELLPELKQRKNAAISNHSKSRVASRDMDELIGLCKGIIADGAVVQPEAEYLLGWINSHQDLRTSWPASMLFERLPLMLEDNYLSPDEELELCKLVKGIAGNNATALGVASASTDLPYSNPACPITFQARTFCITGTCRYGVRKTVAETIESRGGIVQDSITKKLDYLLIGEVGSADWKHSTFGQKIIKAVELIEKGSTLAIVSEHHWSQHL